MKSTQYLCKSHIKNSHIKSQLCKSQNHVENHNFASLKITQKSQLFTSEHKNFSKTKRTILEKEPQNKTDRSPRDKRFLQSPRTDCDLIS